MLDNDNFLHRLKRYTNVSSIVGANAINLATKKLLNIDIEHDKQAKNLVKALGNLKGPIMKIGQILSTIPDSLPDEYLLELQNLQSNAPAMGWPFVRRRMIAELGQDWSSKFQSFNKQASFAASLGQVHQAVVNPGAKLACKLQYPEMLSIVQADIKQFKLILQLYDKYIKGLKTHEIYTEIKERLLEEIDYLNEAKNINLYNKIFAKHPNINIPTVYPELSTDKLLTMSWLEGQKVQDILDKDQEYRNKIAGQAFFAWYYPFYSAQIIHGDPHLGNYTFTADGCVNLLDFGCIRFFNKSFIQGIITLHTALRKDNYDLAVDAYKSWGFTNLTKEIINVLNIWAKLLYEPLIDDKVRYIQQDNSGVYGRQAAAKIHKELRRIGGVTIPKEFVFMDRAAVGIGSLCMHLKAKLNWYKIHQQLIENFH